MLEEPSIQRDTRADRTNTAVRPGFSLLELALVAAIMSIIAVIAVPRYGRFNARRAVEGVARRVATDLALAQRRAKFTSTSQTVSFDVAAETYTLVGMDDPDHSGQTYQPSVASEPYNAIIESASLGGDPDIIFDGYGVPDSGGTVVVQVGRYQKTLTVNAQTGRVTVSDITEVEPP